MAWHLPRDGEAILSEELENVRICLVGRFEIAEVKCRTVNLEPVTQHMQGAFGVQLLHQRAQEQRLHLRL